MFETNEERVSLLGTSSCRFVVKIWAGSSPCKPPLRTIS
jgi:hypothetical protein